MLETLISSETRIKLLLKFFLNAGARGYLRGLEAEFAEGSNAIRLELNKFEKAGMLVSKMQGNKKVFSANQSHPLFSNLHELMLKYVGLDLVVEKVTSKLGDLSAVYLVGDYAKGLDSGIIDLFILAPEMRHDYMQKLINKLEMEIERKIRYVHFDTADDLNKYLIERPHLLLWEHNSLLK